MKNKIRRVKHFLAFYLINLFKNSITDKILNIIQTSIKYKCSLQAQKLIILIDSNIILINRLIILNFLLFFSSKRICNDKI